MLEHARTSPCTRCRCSHPRRASGHMTIYPRDPWPRDHTSPQCNSAQTATMWQSLLRSESVAASGPPGQTAPNGAHAQTLKRTKPIARAEPEPGHEKLSIVHCWHSVDPAASCIHLVWMSADPMGMCDDVAVPCAHIRSAREQSSLTTQQSPSSNFNSVLFSHHLSMRYLHECHGSHRFIQQSECVSVAHKEHRSAFSHYAPKMGEVSIQLVEPQAACRRNRRGP